MFYSAVILQSTEAVRVMYWQSQRLRFENQSLCWRHGRPELYLYLWR